MQENSVLPAKKPLLPCALKRLNDQDTEKSKIGGAMKHGVKDYQQKFRQRRQNE
jgi:hypothetical protein